MGTRDKLALQRSRLANQRTLLSYMRTSIVFFATGITMFKFFFNDKFLLTVAELFIVSSIVIAALGGYLYTKTKRELRLDNFLPKQ